MSWTVSTSIHTIRQQLPEHLLEYEQYLEQTGKITSTVMQYSALMKSMLRQADVRNAEEFANLLDNYSRNSWGARKSARSAYMLFLGAGGSTGAGTNDSGVPIKPQSRLDRIVSSERQRAEASLRKAVHEYVKMYDMSADMLSVDVFVAQVEEEGQERAAETVRPSKGSVGPTSPPVPVPVPVVEESNRKLSEVPPVDSEMASLFTRLRDRVVSAPSTPRDIASAPLPNNDDDLDLE